ncbi:hypothetical protein [Flavimaricola marinus]|uniref:DUF4189 domain-containing protein n=1 Tax=Flavimaricola marinus TaxID=1819565 RepID=A0A238LAN3_9RHOB|nr:hypothetical protein [Flavimaricola marinus]SMY06485.1 hypothetical protein LOM8899_00610 [Flavimaricola marinus]
MIKTLALLTTLGLGGATAPVVEVDFMLPARNVVIYPEATELVQVSAPRLSDTAQAAWDNEFITNSFFSAFAYSKDGGYGYATTSNTPETARNIAMAQCLSMNAQCRIIAEIHPADYKEPGPGDITVSLEIAQYYREVQARPTYRAMAISADGAYSSAWGYASQAEADALVLRDCEGYRNTDLEGLEDWPCILLPGLQ